MSEGLEELGRVLIVDDDPQLLAGIARNLRRLIPVVSANGGEEALTVLRKDRNFSIIICDMRMPGMDGAQFFAEARMLVPDAVRILLTGQADLAAVVSAINQGRIYRFIAKPIDRDELMRVIGAAMAHYRMQRQEQHQLEAARRAFVEWAQNVLMLEGPDGWGRATRVRRIVSSLAEHLGLSDALSMEAAAVLAVTGEALGHATPEALKSLCGNSEPLERVRQIIDELSAPDGAPLGISTKLVKVALKLDAREGNWLSRVDTLERAGQVDPRLGSALRDLEARIAPEGREVDATKLAVGQRLCGPARNADGAMVLPPGIVITPFVLAWLTSHPVMGPVMIAPDAEAIPTPLPMPATA